MRAENIQRSRLIDELVRVTRVGIDEGVEIGPERIQMMPDRRAQRPS